MHGSRIAVLLGAPAGGAVLLLPQVELTGLGGVNGFEADSWPILLMLAPAAVLAAFGARPRAMHPAAAVAVTALGCGAFLFGVLKLADAALGTGPVDAVYRAINRIVDVPNELTEFAVKSVTEGIDAIGEVTIRVESEGKTYVGRGADTDIIVASAKAYMNALNRLLVVRRPGDVKERKGRRRKKR